MRFVRIPNIRVVRKIPRKSATIICGVEGGEMLRLLKECAHHSTKRFTILQTVNADDGCVDEEISKSMPANVTRIYAKNFTVSHPRIKAIPSGRDFRNVYANINLDFLDQPREFINLAYSNFSLNTNGQDRRTVFNQFKGKSWVTSRRVEKWLEYPISREQYVKDVYLHKFNLCPPGRGIDTFRIWESLYLKSIPVVKKSLQHSFFSDLPILMTDDYSHLTKEYLGSECKKMLERDYNIRKLMFSYWKNMIQQDAIRKRL